MRKLTRWTVRFHKWLALIVGLQIVLWVTGGLVMSALPIEQVRAEHTIASPPPAAIELTGLLSPAEAAARSGAGPVFGAKLARWLDRAAYRLDTANGLLLVDARSGAVLSPLDEAAARRVARAGYAGEADIETVEYFAEPTWEYRRTGPAWRVTMADGEGTRLYISPHTGEITARRNDAWRIFDFFWMLHIMDYDAREDFNHPLLIASASIALVTVLAGLVLLLIRLRRTLLVWTAGRR